MKAKFSIITVAYNSEKTIERTIQSILGQSFDDYEYIIVDGLSKDDTLGVVKRYEKDFGDKLKVISEKDNGIYDAMNKGIKAATGEVIGILNSDDFYEKNALEIMNREYEKAVAEGKKHILLYGMVRLTESGKELGLEMYHHSFLDKQMIHHPACFVGADVYQDYGLFDSNLKSAADYELMMRLFHKTETCFIPVYEIITNFERGGMSSNGIGPVETARIKYEYGLVPKSRIMYEKFHAWVVRVYRKIK